MGLTRTLLCFVHLFLAVVAAKQDTESLEEFQTWFETLGGEYAAADRHNTNCTSVLSCRQSVFRFFEIVWGDGRRFGISRRYI